MTIDALIQIIKNVVNWHIERLLLLIILKPSLRITTGSKQALAPFMPGMTGSFEHTCCLGVIKESIVHIGVVSDALKLWSCQFGVGWVSSLEMIWMINLLKHTSTTCLHNLLRSSGRVVLSYLLLRMQSSHSAWWIASNLLNKHQLRLLWVLLL